MFRKTAALTITVAAATAVGATLFGAGVASAAPATSFPGDGTYNVGTQIQPGVYASVVPNDEMHWCLFERLSGLSGEGKDIISQGQDLTPGSQVEVTIEYGDAAFYTSGCGRWVKVGDIPTPAQQAQQQATGDLIGSAVTTGIGSAMLGSTMLPEVAMVGSAALATGSAAGV